MKKNAGLIYIQWLKTRISNVIFRPHFKTHASHEIGRWFKEEGVEKITVSSQDGTVFRSGWLERYPCRFPGQLTEIDLINSLARDIDLSLLVESPETVSNLAGKLRSHLSVYIKIDSGLKRTGISFKDLNTINDILGEIRKSGLISFKGF